MKKITAVILAVCLLLVLAGCSKTKEESLAMAGDKVDVGDVALRPDGEVAVSYENDGMKLLIPLEFDALLLTETPENDPAGVLFSVSEKASIEAAKAAGETGEGAGWLFSIGRIDEMAMQALVCGDMSGTELFAKDGQGHYYVFRHPTDVRYYRENNEAMVRDQEIWTGYSQWAWTSVRESFLTENALTSYAYGNSALEMYLARIAYMPGTEYTLSTLEYGPLAPENGVFDAAPYLERLMNGMTVEYTDEEAPDGEYAVLAFPGDDIRFDFFFAPGGENLIRQVWSDGYEQLYRAAFADETETAAGIMRDWYAAIAESQGVTMLGGWSVTGDAALTEEARGAFDTALEGLVGVSYEPVALLGTQIVSGTNYAILCRAALVYPDAQPYWTVVTVHADLEGAAVVKSIAVLDLGDIAESGEVKKAEEPAAQVPGGWTAAEDAALTAQAQAAFDKAAEKLLGVNYEPVALLGTQVVSGTNYSILARAETVSPDAMPRYTVMTIYEDLQGEVQVLNVAELDIGRLA